MSAFFAAARLPSTRLWSSLLRQKLLLLNTYYRRLLSLRVLRRYPSRPLTAHLPCTQNSTQTSCRYCKDSEVSEWVGALEQLAEELQLKTHASSFDSKSVSSPRCVVDKDLQMLLKRKSSGIFSAAAYGAALKCEYAGVHARARLL